MATASWRWRIGRALVASIYVVAASVAFQATGGLTPVAAADSTGKSGAIAWAQQEKAIDDHDFDYYCLAFAEYAYNVSPKLSINYTGKGNDHTAKELFAFLGNPHAGDSSGNVPAGVLVFFVPNGGSVPDAGHVGISVGGGQMISPLTKGPFTGVVQTAMTYVAPIAGWWMPDSTWPGQATGVKPGGWWIGPTGTWGPSNPRPNGENIQLGFQATDNGNGGLTRVDFTTSIDNGRTWNRLALDAGTKTVSSGQVQYFSHFTLAAPTIVSADVYAQNGSFHLAPQGFRMICLQGGACPSNQISYWDGLYGYGAAGPGMPNPGSQTVASCTVGSNQVALFVDPNYSGQCVVRGIGSYPDPGAIGLPNDSISSVKLGGGINVQLCRDNDLSNTCEWTTLDIPDLATHSVGAKQVSSVNVVGGYAQSGGCSPTASQVALFVATNYGGQCVVKEIGSYPDPGAMGLPNDSTSSVQVGSNVKLQLCRDSGFSNTCEWIDQNVGDLGTHSVGSMQASSVQVILRGGISLCDGTNYSGSCHLFSDGTTNLSNSGWANRARSVLFSSAYDHHYHIVLWTGPNQTGALYHADSSVADLGSPYASGIQSINIYPHTAPPSPNGPSPAMGAVLPSTTTSVSLSWNGADPNQINQAHVWGTNGYDLPPSWATGAHLSLSGLTPGQYYWQTQSQNEMGAGPWSDIWSFSINTVPHVQDGAVTVLTGDSVALQVQAVDADSQSPALAVPAMASGW